MSSTTKILLTGATGYLGSQILWRLLQHPNSSSLEITALVRSTEKAEKLKTKYGVNAIVGSLSDLELVEQLASNSDVILQVADSDDLSMTKAILKGAKNRYKTTATPLTLIHTSGTGVLADNAVGLNSNKTIWLDDDPKMMATLPDEAIHRNVDTTIVEADAQGYVKTYIILPAFLWGLGTGPLVEEGISNPFSFATGDTLKASIDRAAAGMVGKGVNIWGHVNVEDTADLYIVILDRILSGIPTDHGKNGYYFAENGECTMYDLSYGMGKALVELGKAESPIPTTFSQEELEKYYAGATYIGTNSRCRANHARQIGWKPKKSTKDMYASFRGEAEALIVKYNGQPFTYFIADLIRAKIAAMTQATK